MVNKDCNCFGFANCTGQLAKCLRHQARLKSDMGITHFPFNFRFRNQCCYGVNYDNIHRSTAYKSFCDLKCLFPCIRLGEQQFVNVDAKLACI
ncbi:hypothetical protein D3C76_971880 [compost metagenome]